MTREQRLEKALRDLLEKLYMIETDPCYHAVITIASVHGCPYNGPSYAEEKKAAEEALKE